MENLKNVFIQLIDKPARKVIIKCGQKATEYWTYCQEVGCDVWGVLTSIKSLCGEPVCLWLPEMFILAPYIRSTVKIADRINGAYIKFL